MAPSTKPQPRPQTRPGTVYKYPLNLIAKQTLMLPVGAVPLKIALSKEIEPDIWLWAQVNPDNDPVLNLEVTIVGTGHPIPDDAGEYFDTVFYPHALGGADFVFHLFFKETY